MTEQTAPEQGLRRTPKDWPYEEDVVQVKKHCPGCGEGFWSPEEKILCKVCVGTGYKEEDFGTKRTDPCASPEEALSKDEALSPLGPEMGQTPVTVGDSLLEFSAEEMQTAAGRLEKFEEMLDQVFLDGYRKGKQEGFEQGTIAAYRTKFKKGEVPAEMPSPPTDFDSGLTQLINQFSMENESDTPDFILGEGLSDLLRVVQQIIVRRADWYAEKKPETPFELDDETEG